MLGDDGIGQGQPCLHAVVDQFRLVVEGVHDVFGAQEAAEEHIAADEVLLHHEALVGGGLGLGHALGQVGVSLR